MNQGVGGCPPLSPTACPHESGDSGSGKGPAHVLLYVEKTGMPRACGTLISSTCVCGFISRQHTHASSSYLCGKLVHLYLSRRELGQLFSLPQRVCVGSVREQLQQAEVFLVRCAGQLKRGVAADASDSEKGVGRGRGQARKSAYGAVVPSPAWSLKR